MWSGLEWNVTVVEMMEIWRESACNLTTSIHNQFEKRKKPSLVENKRERERGGGGCCNHDKNMILQREGEREREMERELHQKPSRPSCTETCTLQVSTITD